MKMRHMLLTGACLVLGATAVLAQDQRPTERDRGKGRPGEFNAKPAKGERYQDTLKVGAPAPDFALPDLSGEKQLTLSDSKGKKPVVLVFGSCTCPPFRRQIGEVERIYQSYKDKADFVLVYIREAHPGSQIPGINNGETIQQTETLAERRELAADFAEELKLTMPVLVDKEDNKVNATYAGWPNRLVIVGVDGKIAYMEKTGAGFMWGEVEQWLKNFVAAPGAIAANTAAAAAGKEVKGRLVNFNADQNTLTLTTDGKDQTFPIDKAAKFVMSGRKNQLRDIPGGLGGLKEGTDVTLHTQNKDGKEIISKVTIEGKTRKRDKQ